MNQGDAKELLCKLSDRDAKIFLLHYILNETPTAISKILYTDLQDVQNHLKVINITCSHLEYHQEAIAALQECISRYLFDGFFVPK